MNVCSCCTDPAMNGRSVLVVLWVWAEGARAAGEGKNKDATAARWELKKGMGTRRRSLRW